jgi:hypothetical protein
MLLLNRKEWRGHKVKLFSLVLAPYYFLIKNGGG